MNVAIVHYWLVGMRGGERVLEALCEMFPTAHIFTHVYAPESTSEVINKHVVNTTFIQRLPLATKWYQRYLPLMPLALEQLDLSSYDLVISSESGPAKGVIVRPDAVHICYCHTPMRYAWDMYHSYRADAGPALRFVMPVAMHYMRAWDVMSAARVDHFIANSRFVAKRIERYYKRAAEVIPPPVDVGSFHRWPPTHDNFYLVVGQLVNYKRADLAVKAFARMDRKLVVIGEGEQLGSLRKDAPANVVFLGWQPTEVVRDHYSRCRAVVFPGQEDFGIVPVEAMASGRPVIAYGRGGATDSVRDGETGVLFYEQTPAALVEAVERFETIEAVFGAERLRNSAEEFSRHRFEARIRAAIKRAIASSRRPRARQDHSFAGQVGAGSG